MIIWITGKANAGKTTLANRIKCGNTIILDSDNLRNIWTDLKFTDSGRLENCCRLAKLAKLLEVQGFIVIVTAVTPTEKIRIEIYDICGCDFIHITGGYLWKNTTYETPISPDFIIEGNKDNKDNTEHE